jgi:hypothetical protein
MVNETNGQRLPDEGPDRNNPQRSADKEHLHRLEQKFQLVRDRTGAVVKGYSTGFYLHGNGGIGKSYVVVNELERLQANYKLFNSRMTGRGLYNALEKFPDAVHVLEDMEQIVIDHSAQGVLRSALWGTPKEGGRGPTERLVTWTTYVKSHTFVFTGGVIMLANVPLRDIPQLDALKTRITNMHLEVPDMELRALMWKVAGAGYASQGRQLPAEACLEVCDHLIHQSLSMHRALDMRLLVNSLEDHLQWAGGDSGCHWKDLVNSRLRERPTHFQEPVTVTVTKQAERRQQELQIAQEIVSTTAGRHERRLKWESRTGKSEQTLYRRIAELGEISSFSNEN